MHLLELSAFAIYFTAILSIALLTYKKQKTDTDFVIGNRSLNYWLTALSAQASDMSSWLFMAYPALIFAGGVFNAWIAIGLITMMFFNWHFIAPKIRIATEKTNSLTLNTYFEMRFHDKGGLRIISSILSVLFFSFYISAFLVSLGYLVDSLFNINYLIGITIGLAIVVFYVFLGGYRTVAWIDLFQGFFLMGIILFIPLYLIYLIHGISPITEAIKIKNLTLSFFPDYSINTWTNILFLFAGWGLGYFGQPHIITKFMGIKKVENMHKAKYVGLSWQILSLFGATLIGLIGTYLFPTLPNPELITLEIVKNNLHPLFRGLVLCAILATTTNVMAAQFLVIASTLSEDFYKKFFHKQASHKEVLWVSRYSIILVAIFAYAIAFFKISTIYNLVLYSWSGLGSAFGPLLIFSLYTKNTSKKCAYAGMLTGGIISAVWPLFNTLLAITVPPMIPGFMASSLVILSISFIENKLKKQTCRCS
jgi:sodium/proline symporter